MIPIFIDLKSLTTQLTCPSANKLVLITEGRMGNEIGRDMRSGYAIGIWERDMGSVFRIGMWDLYMFIRIWSKT